MKLSRLYGADETAWLDEMSKLAKERRLDQLDYRHLSEYLADMAKRDRREVFSRLVVYLVHRLKWDFQRRMRSRSWALTLLHQHNQLEVMLESKTLRNYAQDNLGKAYAQAVRLAAVEMDREEHEFPEQCPYTLDDILADKQFEGGDDNDQ